MQEINLYKLISYYARNWWLIASLTLLGLLSGVIYNQFIQEPLYKSNATLLFINPGSTTSSQDATLLSNYVQLFESRRVLEPVISAQKLGVTYNQFSSAVSAVNEKGTEVIKLSVSTDSADKSQRFLKAAVQSFKKQAETLYGTDKLQIVDNASDAAQPYNVNKALQLAIATGAGLILALIALFFVFDAKGGKVEPRAVKQVKPKAPKAPKTPKTSNSNTLRTNPALRGIKKYFTEYKQNLMTLPAPDETMPNQATPTKNINNK